MAGHQAGNRQMPSSKPLRAAIRKHGGRSSARSATHPVARSGRFERTASGEESKAVRHDEGTYFDETAAFYRANAASAPAVATLPCASHAAAARRSRPSITLPVT